MRDSTTPAENPPHTAQRDVQAEYDAWHEAWDLLCRRAAKYERDGDRRRAYVMRAIAASARVRAAELALFLVNRPAK